MFIVTPIVGFCVCSLFCYAIPCAFLLVLQIFLVRKRELVALLWLSCWCLVIVIVLWLFLTVPPVGLQFVIVVFPDHTHKLFDEHEE